MTWNLSIGSDIGTGLINTNSQMGYLIGGMILLAVFSLIIIMTKDKSSSSSLMIASLITFIVSLFLNAMTLIPPEWSMIPPILVVASIFIGHFSKSEPYV